MQTVNVTSDDYNGSVLPYEYKNKTVTFWKKKDETKSKLF